MSSKIIGLGADGFARTVVDAIRAVKTITDAGDIRHSVKAVGIVKALGGSI